MPKHFLILMVAVIFETIGTAALHASAQFTKPVPIAVMLVTYILSLYLLTLVMTVWPVGVVYAIWSGLGIVLITAVGYVWFRQSLDTPALIGMALIVGGVVIIQAFSKVSA